MKKIILSLLLLIISISCVQGNVDINFTDVAKGDVKSTLQFSKNAFTKQDLDDMLKKETTKANFTYSFVKEGTDKNFGDYFEYTAKAQFNNEKEFKDLISLMKIDFLNGSKSNISIVENKENKTITVNAGNSGTFKYKVKVNGKIIESKDGKVKGSTVSFDEGQTVSFTYKKSFFSLMSLLFILLILIIVALIASVLVIFKRKRAK